MKKSKLFETYVFSSATAEEITDRIKSLIEDLQIQYGVDDTTTTQVQLEVLTKLHDALANADGEMYNAGLKTSSNSMRKNGIF